MGTSIRNTISTYVFDILKVSKCNYLYFCHRDLVLEHMDSSEHCHPPEDNSEWDRPDFLFPTYEDDNLLCSLDDEIYDKDNNANDNLVESEELEDLVKDSLLRDEKFRRSITS